MMNKLLAFSISFLLLFVTACTGSSVDSSMQTKDNNGSKLEVENINDYSDSTLDDPHILRFVYDNIYSTLENECGSDDYIIEDLAVKYISKEYLEDLEYNSKENIYFGYTLSEIANQFDENKYIFTLGDNGETVVKQFEAYDDTYETMVKDVAIGSGVILICATVSVATGGAGLPAVSMVFAASAKTGAIMALSSGTIGGVSAGIATCIQTGDINQAMKEGGASAAKGFKWGAITGVVTGGAQKVVTLKHAKSIVDTTSDRIPSFRDSEIRALKKFGGEEQVSYLNKKIVPKTTKGCTRPDLVVKTKSGLKAYEIKNYDLKHNLPALKHTLRKQLKERVANMPSDTKQIVVLDVKGRNYSDKMLKATVKVLKSDCSNVCPELKILVMK